MKKSVLALWIAISLTGLSLAGIWGFAWYYYVIQGNLRTGDDSSGNGRGGNGSGGSNGAGTESDFLGEMSGTVKDEDTGEPIEGASVQWQLEGTASSVFTDDNGCFSIPDLEPGQYRLLVTKEGYEDSGEMGVPVDEDTATVLLDDILLKKEVDFYQYLREVHIPDVGKASRESLTVGNVQNMESMGILLQPMGGLGFLSGDVRDYDNDGEKEMIVIDVVCTTMGETDLGRLGYHRGEAPCLALDLQLYGAVDGQVQLLDSVYITEMERVSWGPMVFGVQDQDGRFYFYGYSSMTDYTTYGSRPFTVYHVEDKKLVMDYIGGHIGWGQSSYQGDPNAALGTRNLSLLDTPLEYVYNCLKQGENPSEESLWKLRGSVFTCITMERSGSGILYQAEDYTFISAVLQKGEDAIRNKRPGIPKEYQQPEQAAGAEGEADALMESITAATGIALTKETKDVGENLLLVGYKAPGGTSVRITYDQASGQRKTLIVSSSGGNRTAEWTVLKDAFLSSPKLGLDQGMFGEYFGECSFNLGSKEGNGVRVMVGNAGSCVLNIQW